MCCSSNLEEPGTSQTIKRNSHSLLHVCTDVCSSPIRLVVLRQVSEVAFQWQDLCRGFSCDLVPHGLLIQQFQHAVL